MTRIVGPIHALIVGLAAGILFCAGPLWIDASAQDEADKDAPKMLGDAPKMLEDSWKDDPVFVSISAGLDYLSLHQNRNGSWDGDIGFKLNSDYEVERNSKPHVGVTALAGIAFLAGGHLPERGKYGETVSKTIDFLLGCVNDEGYVTRNGSRMYSHAFATLFLAEIYGMTRRSDVERKLQESVNLIVKCQNKVGSWRYKPFAPESDMSVTVCQLMALRAARNVGIKVPKSTIDRAVQYVLRSYVDASEARRHQLYYGRERYYRVDEGAFYYQVYENGSSAGMRSSFSLTAAGVTSLFNAGEYAEGRLTKSLEYLGINQDIVSSDYHQHYFYWYGHYYAVQAMYIAGEPWWTRYWNKISRELLKNQRSDGHWDNYVGPGENFATAVAAIILQVPMGYLPIFER